MSDSTKESIYTSAEATALQVHPDVSPHLETTGDMEHLGRIHAELSVHGVKTTGELTQVLTEPQAIDSSQFDTKPSNLVRFPQRPMDAPQGDTSWGFGVMARKLKERFERKRQEGEQKGELPNAA